MIRVGCRNLWLGNAHDCRDIAALESLDIAAVVQLAKEEPIPVLPREMILLRIPLMDGDSNDPSTLRLAIHGLADLIRAKTRTLVCCSAGVSRSPAVAACAIAQVEGLSPADCLKEISTLVRPDTSPGLWNALLAVIAGE